MTSTDTEAVDNSGRGLARCGISIPMKNEETAPENQAVSAPSNQLIDLRFSMYSDAERSIWSARYQPTSEQDILGIPAGTYCMEEIPHGPASEALLRPADRLCALTQHQHVATVFALASSGARDQIWYEQVDGGTLAQAISQRGKLPGEEVATIAAGLVYAMTWFHQQQMAFTEFTAHRIFFTSNGTLKVLAPDVDLRGKNSTVAEEYYRKDIAAVASILWECLTGEAPGDVLHRPPLKLLLPATKPELGVTLEHAIDQDKPQPSLQEINAIIQHHFSAQPVDLFASAHPSVRGELPARRQPSKKKATSRKILGSKVSQPAQGIQQKLRRAGSACLILAVIGAGSYALFEHLNSPTAPVTAESQETTAQTSMATTSVEASPMAEQNPEEIMTHLVEQRNSVLAQGQRTLISSYAQSGSDLEKQDAQLLSRDTHRTLKSMPLNIVSIEDMQTDGGELSMRVTLSADKPDNFTPENAQSMGLTLKGNTVQQEVTFTVRQSDEGWRLISAEPRSPSKTSS